MQKIKNKNHPQSHLFKRKKRVVRFKRSGCLHWAWDAHQKPSQRQKVNMPSPGCTALQVQTAGLQAQHQWKPEVCGKFPKSHWHKFTRFTRFPLPPPREIRTNTLPAAAPLIMHSKFEQQGKQSDKSSLFISLKWSFSVLTSFCVCSKMTQNSFVSDHQFA